MSRIERQLEIEIAANEFSYTRLNNEVSKRISYGQADELHEGRTILLAAIDKVAAKLDEYFKLDLRGTKAVARDTIAYDFAHNTKDLAYILLVTIVRSISKDVTVPVTSLIKRINNSIYESLVIHRLHNDTTNHGAFVDKRYAKRSELFRTRKKIEIAKRTEILKDTELDSQTIYIGATLLDVVIKSGANLIERRNVRTKGSTTAHIVYTDECYRMVMQSRDRLLVEYRKFPIFVSKPKDWESFIDSGGYYSKDIYKLPLIKTRAPSTHLIKSYFEKTDNQVLFDVLNTLQATKWRINTKVYEVLDTIFTNNMVDPESAYNNPYLIGHLPYNGSQEPEDYVNVRSYGELYTEGKYKGLPVDKKQMRKYFSDIESQKDLITSNFGKAIMLTLVLHNAREYIEEDEIYFSYQYDFRGRIYPIQQHLQPQGKGEAKALLEFVEGVPIENEAQLKWFKIHGANCYGYDKLSYEGRVSKIDAMEDDIKAIAENPLGNRNLWKDTDEPFLFLAWCFEYAEYLSNPDGFLSHLPISLDATCSGIQMYSGLLLDKDGAEAVNVIGKDRQDIYQRVADKVNEYLRNGDYVKQLEYTTSNGLTHIEDTKPTADSLKGKVTRSLTKRNTMTQPYSVTKFGMYEQLKAELIELENNNKKFWVGDIWLVAKILTDLNDRAIAEVVKGARVGQEYLKEVTADVVKNGEYVFFTTPLTKFPVLQKIHVTKVDRVITPVGKLSVRRSLDELNIKKMVNGIAPNFIHSLDASLLASTVLKLKGDGCSSFHLIHDSYGVPINQVENLNKRVRESYVELFKTQPLQHFIKQVHPSFEKRVEDVMIGTLNLDEVLTSEYIFS